MKSSCLKIAISFVLLSHGVFGQLKGPGRAGQFTMERFFRGKWTYQPSWSPDGRYVSFLWDDWVKQDIYIVPTAGGSRFAFPIRRVS